VSEALRLFGKAIEVRLRLDPNLCISNLKDRVSTLRPDVLAKFVAALRKAGLPE